MARLSGPWWFGLEKREQLWLALFAQDRALPALVNTSRLDLAVVTPERSAPSRAVSPFLPPRSRVWVTSS